MQQPVVTRMATHSSVLLHDNYHVSFSASKRLADDEGRVAAKCHPHGR